MKDKFLAKNIFKLYFKYKLHSQNTYLGIKTSSKYLKVNNFHSSIKYCQETNG